MMNLWIAELGVTILVLVGTFLRKDAMFWLRFLLICHALSTAWIIKVIHDFMVIWR